MDIKNFSIEELKDTLKEANIALFHAKQVMRWINQKGASDFSQMTDLSKEVRELLSQKFVIGKIKVIHQERSKDGTQKFVLQLSDNNVIETVLIPAKERATICLSSQVGCKFNCAFCLSAQGGFKRDLKPSEIIDQFILAQENSSKRISHIVFMGIGEPLDNYDNVLKAIKIFNNREYGFGIAIRRITISTSGIIPAIEKLSKENMQFELSVSLHSAIEPIRNKLMPVNKVYPLKELIPTLKKYSRDTKRQITFEYAMIKDVNMGLNNARALIDLTKGLDCKVNLIAYNASGYKNFNSPDRKEINEFKSILKAANILFTERLSRGSDIQAACGQLRSHYLNDTANTI